MSKYLILLHHIQNEAERYRRAKDNIAPDYSIVRHHQRKQWRELHYSLTILNHLVNFALVNTDADDETDLSYRTLIDYCQTRISVLEELKNNTNPVTKEYENVLIQIEILKDIIVFNPQ